MMTIREFAYYARYGVSTLLFRRRKPIVAGVPLTDRCNLSCLHCVVANVGRGPYSFSRITEIFKTFYERGARILYLQGGEVFTWSDSGKNVNDVIRAARAMGFFKIAAVTNGMFPIEIESDAVCVSVDGPEKYHDEIRGAGAFKTTLTNIRNSSHPRISANITVNKKNKEGVEEIVRIMSGEKNIRGISVNLHTPYPGVEGLALENDERKEVLQNVIRMKRQGYRILNSIFGLTSLITGRYRRPVNLIQMLEQDQVFECCWGRQYDGVCERCGYGIIPELSGIQYLNPAALLGAFRLFYQ